MHEDGHAPTSSQTFPHVSRETGPSRIDEIRSNLVLICPLDATVLRRIEQRSSTVSGVAMRFVSNVTRRDPSSC